VRFSLPTAERASLELIDIAGRRVEQREVGSLGPGQHAVILDGAAHLSPGVYLVRVSQGASVRTARAVVVR